MQNLNLYMPNPDLNKLLEVHFRITLSSVPPRCRDLSKTPCLQQPRVRLQEETLPPRANVEWKAGNCISLGLWYKPLLITLAEAVGPYTEACGVFFSCVLTAN